MVLIRKALKKDIDGVEKGYTDLIMYEMDHVRNSNWVLGGYPTRESADKAFSAGTLYVLEEDGKICASMIMNEIQLEEYKSINWEYPAEDDRVRVVHTLCISHESARKGYGRMMMEYAENESKNAGFQVLRIDTYAGNEPAKGLYKSLGFRYAGKLESLFMGKIPEELVFFEKKL